MKIKRILNYLQCIRHCNLLYSKINPIVEGDTGYKLEFENNPNSLTDLTMILKPTKMDPLP